MKRDVYVRSVERPRRGKTASGAFRETSSGDNTLEQRNAGRRASLPVNDDRAPRLRCRIQPRVSVDVLFCTSPPQVPMEPRASDPEPVRVTESCDRPAYTPSSVAVSPSVLCVKLRHDPYRDVATTEASRSSLLPVMRSRRQLLHENLAASDVSNCDMARLTRKFRPLHPDARSLCRVAPRAPRLKENIFSPTTQGLLSPGRESLLMRWQRTGSV